MHSADMNSTVTRGTISTSKKEFKSDEIDRSFSHSCLNQFPFLSHRQRRLKTVESAGIENPSLTCFLVRREC